MARIAFLVKQPKRALGALAVLVAATGVVVGSGASFSATSANPTNQFAAGSLSMTNSKAPGAVLSASGMKPGDTVTGTVDIQNTGTLAGNFTLRRTALTNSDAVNPLAPQLNLVVVDCGEWPAAATPEACDDGDDVSLSTGALSAFTGTVNLGNYSSNEKHTYKFSVTLSSSAGDVHQGDNATAEFTWDAAQS